MLNFPFQRRQDNLSGDEDGEGGGIKLGQGQSLDNCSTSNCNLL